MGIVHSLSLLLFAVLATRMLVDVYFNHEFFDVLERHPDTGSKPWNCPYCINLYVSFFVSLLCFCVIWCNDPRQTFTSLAQLTCFTPLFWWTTAYLSWLLEDWLPDNLRWMRPEIIIDNDPVAPLITPQEFSEVLKRREPELSGSYQGDYVAGTFYPSPTAPAGDSSAGPTSHAPD